MVEPKKIFGMIDTYKSANAEVHIRCHDAPSYNQYEVTKFRDENIHLERKEQNLVTNNCADIEMPI